MARTSQHERIEIRYIEEEMRESFIDYSMSVIVQRALPDARDGLKPVHRRILYAMYEIGLLPGRDHKKSATVVGDVLGKYHPHGDSAVYDTLVRMVQDFSMRYPLVDGQGNFGSIDGDSAAAYRYTEARLSPVAVELLADIEKDTVDFSDNFDGRLQEPTVLPTRLPHLLLNGTDGIAVGMSTKIPPHNLGELLRATQHLVEHPDCEVADLTDHVQGPDFPTGGYIWGRDAIRDAYETGRGLVEMRARMHVEEGNYGKSSLVVTELPYQVNKSRVIEQITRQVRRGRLGAITDLRDESDRDGLRLVIELKRDADARKLLPKLFKKTQLRYTFGVITLALVDGRPVELDLKEALQCFVDHRLEVIHRMAAHELEACEERAHVVEGLLAALDDIDRVIRLIRSSDDPAEARDRLEADMDLTRRQADAILSMRLQRLTGLEHDRLHEELRQLEARIGELRRLVEDEAVRREHLVSDLEELVGRYGDARRTEILDGEGEFPLPTGGGGQATLVLVSRRGYVKAQPVRTSAGMAGAEAMRERENDFARWGLLCRGDDTLLVLTRRGNAHAVPLGDLPRGTRSSRGRPLTEFLDLEDGDEPVALFPVESDDDEGYVLTVSRRGQVKRTALEAYANVRSGGIIGAGVADDDEILAALRTDGDAELVLATRTGQAIRFEEDEIRPMGRSARGVKGIDLEEGDEVVAALAPRRDAELLVASAAGFGKRVPVTELRLQGRAGKGAAILPDRDSAGDLVGLLDVYAGDDVVWELGSGEMVETAVAEVRARSRSDASLRVIGNLGDRGVEALHPVHADPGRGSTRDPDAPDDGGRIAGDEAAAEPTRPAGSAEPETAGESGQGELGLGDG
ncbi:MAG: DNA gyrase subunit A [Gemmatimonadota bacterium]